MFRQSQKCCQHQCLCLQQQQQNTHKAETKMQKLGNAPFHSPYGLQGDGESTAKIVASETCSGVPLVATFKFFSTFSHQLGYNDVLMPFGRFNYTLRDIALSGILIATFELAKSFDF